MSGPMYFNPTPEQIAVAKASTCGTETPKDPSDCNSRCGFYDGKPCANYRQREQHLSGLRMQVLGRGLRQGPLTIISPMHRFCLLDDGMGELARVSTQAFQAAHYHANSGDVH